MILNYIKISLRNSRKRLLYTVINTLGLAIGITSFLLLFGYIFYEKNFDDFHLNGDKVYRVLFERYKGGELKSKSANSMPGLGNRIKEHIKEVKYLTRFTSSNNGSIVKTKELIKEESNLYYVDNDFFKMFSFDLIEGDKNSALNNPNSIILTEYSANLFFGNKSSCLGRELEIVDDYSNKKYTVTGVVANPPKNTKFDFGYLCSFNSIYTGEKWFENNWSWYGFETYIGLGKNTDLAVVKNVFPDFIDKYKTDPNEADKKWRFKFQALDDINLNSNFSNLAANQDKKKDNLNFLSLISILVLLISWVNYINLTTARSMERAREIGVRKAIGAYRNQISKQFFVESVLTNIFAITLSLILVVILIKPFYSLIGLNYNLEIFSYPLFWIYISAIFMISILVSGLYPALVASKFKSIEVLKSKTTSSKGSNVLRVLLVGVQFLISLVLIIGTFIVIAQNDFIKNKDLGVDISNVHIVSKPKIFKKWKFKKKYKIFIAELKKLPQIEEVSASFAAPSKGSWQLATKESTKTDSDRLNHTVIGIDNNYIPLYDIKVIEGRNLRETELKSNVALISLNSMKTLNLKSPKEAIGKKLNIETFDKEEFEIIGVIDDYHHRSLQNEISTMILIPNGEKGLFSVPNCISIKSTGNRLKTNLSEKIKGVYDKFFKEDVFEIKLLENEFLEQYKEEDRRQSIFSIFSFLAIILSFVGVMGLSSYIATLKEKEIAIRKVIGSRMNDIIWVLSKEFIIIYLITILISIPIVFYLMGNWLLDFPYRIDITSTYFIKSFVIIALLIIFVISFNVFKALRKPAIKVLKEE